MGLRTAATIVLIPVGQFSTSHHSMSTFTFIPRNYLHFDLPIAEAYAEQLATNPEAVARHPFYPSITYNVTTQKIRKKPGGGVELAKPKTRVIAYAAHKDSHIFAHYSQ